MLAAGDGRDDRPAAGLDVVAVEPLLRAANRARRLDANRRRAFAFDRRRPSPAGTRTARRRAAPSRRGGSRCALARPRPRGAPSRCPSPTLRRDRTTRRCSPSGASSACPGSSSGTGAHRRRAPRGASDRPPRRKVAARRREARRPAPRQQRPQQQHRAAQPADQRRIGSSFVTVAAPDAQRRRADALDLGAETEQQLAHHLDVAECAARW